MREKYNKIETIKNEEIRKKSSFQGLGLNLTGGTKTMSFAALMWATLEHDGGDIHPFYVDTGRREVLFFDNEFSFPSMPFDRTIKVS